MSRQPYSRADRNRAARARGPRSRFGRPVVPGMSWSEGGVTTLAVGPTIAWCGRCGRTWTVGRDEPCACPRKTLTCAASASSPIGTLTFAEGALSFGEPEYVSVVGVRCENGEVEWRTKPSTAERSSLVLAPSDDFSIVIVIADGAYVGETKKILAFKGSTMVVAVTTPMPGEPSSYVLTDPGQSVTLQWTWAEVDGEEVRGWKLIAVTQTGRVTEHEDGGVA